MDPDQTSPIRAVLSESTLFVGKASKTFSRRQKQTNFAVIDALRVKQDLYMGQCLRFRN